MWWLGVLEMWLQCLDVVARGVLEMWLLCLDVLAECSGDVAAMFKCGG